MRTTAPPVTSAITRIAAGSTEPSAGSTSRSRGSLASDRSNPATRSLTGTDGDLVAGGDGRGGHVDEVGDAGVQQRAGQGARGVVGDGEGAAAHDGARRSGTLHP
jgi:hypothetical protein